MMEGMQETLDSTPDAAATEVNARFALLADQLP